MDKQALIDHLNKDLAGELSAIIQYLTYAAKASGPFHPQPAELKPARTTRSGRSKWRLMGTKTW